jgi:hypothetical protein
LIIFSFQQSTDKPAVVELSFSQRSAIHELVIQSFSFYFGPFLPFTSCLYEMKEKERERKREESKMILRQCFAIGSISLVFWVIS